MTTYCTESDINRLLSAQGVIAFADHDDDGTADAGVVDDAINEASGEIDLYCSGRYDSSDLAGSTLINRWCTALAAFFLCRTRGNPIPESIADQAQRLLAEPDGLLAKIAAGLRNLPGVPLRADLRPAWSNLIVDRRWAHSKVRVTRANSSDAPTELTQDTAHEPVISEYDI